MSKPTKKIAPERKQLVDEMFAKYDKDKSGQLQLNQMVLVLNEILKRMNYNYVVYKNQVQQIVKLMDKNSDMRVNPQQLSDILDIYVKKF